MQSNANWMKAQNRKSARILGMTRLQVTILVILSCLLCGLVGGFAILILDDSPLLANIQSVVPISFPTRIPPPTSTPDLMISGNSINYLPTQSELPAGFVLMGDGSGPITSDYGDFYQLAFTNSDNLFLHREVNVFYIAGIANSINNAMYLYNSISDPSSAPGITTREPFPIGEFTNVDEVTLFFGQDTTELGTYAINYTLVFRYQNFIANIIVSAPVDSFTGNDAMQIQNRLRKAVIFYSSFVIDKLPVHHLTNVPQPPFGNYVTP